MDRLLPGCFLFLFFLFSGWLPAQSYLGFSGGGDFSSAVHFRAGIPLEKQLTSFLALQAELGYIERENDQLLSKLDWQRNYRQASVSYFQAGLLTKWKMDFESIVLYALAGPEAGYGIHLSANYWEGQQIWRRTLSFREMGISRWDIGMNLGGGIEANIRNNRKIFLEFRYYLGLFDIDKQSSFEIFNQGGILNMGFFLPLSGD